VRAGAKPKSTRLVGFTLQLYERLAASCRDPPDFSGPRLLDRLPQFVDEIGAFPGEAAVRLRRAAEMAVALVRA
jgi:hypothetical protein